MTYPISLKVEYPQKLSRLTTLFRMFLVIPHLFILYFLGIVAGVITIISWFAILMTGLYPRSLFDFIAHYYRWNTRVMGYGTLLLTDKYPPFGGNE